MAEEKDAPPETRKRKKTGAGAGQKGAAPKGGPGAPPAEGQGEPLRDRMDQLGSILVKGLDLVEASITLGVNLANRLGAVVQEQASDRVERASRPYPEWRETPYAEPGMGTTPYYQDEPGRAGGAETPPIANYVVNRLPLFPGSPVRVTFTINNDSASSPRRLRLRVEGFVGELQRAVLDGKGFTVKPATRVIEPLDFDKFTLAGAIPQDAVPDAYGGWIVVSSQHEELRIPVRLVVGGQP